MPRAVVAVGMGVKDDGGGVLGREIVLGWQGSLGEDKKVDKGGRAMVAALIQGRIGSWGLARRKNRTLRRPRVFQGSF